MTRWSPSRRAVLEGLAAELLQHYGRGRTIVAVDGAIATGKSQFADDLGQAMRAAGHDVFRASVDDFLRPRAERHAQGADSPRGHYEDAYDYSVLRRVLIEPYRMNGSTGFVTAAWDAARDRQLEPKWLSGPADAVLLIDGVYLNRPELRGLWNASIWLDTDPEVRAARIHERAGIGPDDPRIRRAEDAQRLYEASKPREAATIVVDNTDPSAPRRQLTDSC